MPACQLTNYYIKYIFTEICKKIFLKQNQKQTGIDFILHVVCMQNFKFRLFVDPEKIT